MKAMARHRSQRSGRRHTDVSPLPSYR